MDKTIFGQQLINALAGLGVDARKCSYKIYPIMEEGKKYSTKVDFVELYTSLRFRKPSEVLRNHTGIEPFIIMPN